MVGGDYVLFFKKKKVVSRAFMGFWEEIYEAVHAADKRGAQVRFSVFVQRG